MDLEYKSDILISFIIPVYNLEHYIERTLVKLINEYKKYMEFIIVDDGSTDGSAEIIDNICRENENFRFYKKANGGVSSARNFGLKHAKGKYISFIDGDDIVNLGAVDENINLFKNNIDFIVFGFCIVNGKNTVDYLYNDFNGDSAEDLLKYSIKSERLNSCWSKFYLSDVINSNNLEFPETMKIGEDKVFVLRFISKCRSYKIVDQILYEYMVREGSAISEVGVLRFRDLEAIYLELKNYCSNKQAASAAYYNIFSILFLSEIKYSFKEFSKIMKYIYSSELSSVFSFRLLGNTAENRMVFLFIKNKLIVPAFLYSHFRAKYISIKRKLENK